MEEKNEILNSLLKIVTFLSSKYAMWIVALNFACCVVTNNIAAVLLVKEMMGCSKVLWKKSFPEN